MKTLTICGSMRFADEMQKIAYSLEVYKGYNILQCVYCEDNQNPSDIELTRLSNAHYQKIDMSDGIYVVNIGGYIFQRKRIMDDTVGSIPKRQRQLRCCKPSEEGQHQSCQSAFAGACLAHKKEDKLGNTSTTAQKFNQRTEENVRQKRVENVGRHQFTFHKGCKDFHILIGTLVRKIVAA